MDKETKLHVCWNLHKEHIKPEDIALRLSVDRPRIYRWLSSFKRRGLKRTIKHYRNSKKGQRNRIDALTKKYIFKIRGEYRNCCGQKIRYLLNRDYNRRVSVATIYRVLGERYELRKGSKRKLYGDVPKSKREREVVQTDTVFFGDIFAYTYVDVNTV